MKFSVSNVIVNQLTEKKFDPKKTFVLFILPVGQYVDGRIQLFSHTKKRSTLSASEAVYHIKWRDESMCPKPQRRFETGHHTKNCCML
jgi:hypothetical protein